MHRALTLIALLASTDALAAKTPKPGARRTGVKSSSSSSKLKVQQPPLSALLTKLGLAPPPPPPPANPLAAIFGSKATSAPAPPALQLPQAVTAALESAPFEAARTALAEVRPLQVFSGFMLAVFLAGSSVVATGQAVSGYLARDGNGQVLERAMLFGTILDNVKAAYVDDNIDITQLFETGVNAMLSMLDPYSTYENAKEAEDLNVRTTGRYGGVGLTIGKDGDDVLVLGALEGYAFDAGVRAGDRILAIDDTSVKPLEVEAVKNLLRGEPGTSVQLTVQRDGSTEPDRKLVMPVQRRLVRLPDVTLATLKNGVGYLKVEGFSEGTAEETARAIRALQDAEGPQGLKALVIDLRDNPGGLLDAAVAVSQQLVPEGTEIVSTAGRVYGEGTSLSYRSTKPPMLNPRTRLIMIVNSNTASAAEIVAGVVQDTDRGVVVGERTYGKGLVQVVEPLPGGGSLKLTVAKYYTPSGRCIQAVSYAGGRVVASAAPTGAAAISAADAAALNGVPATDGSAPEAVPGGDSLAPAATPGVTVAPKSPTASPAKPGALRKKNPDSPGALLRIDPTEPSKPGASSEDAAKPYFTSGGRVVKGGGGIGPDAIIEGRQVGELERSLIQQGLFFQFATEWLQRHAATTEQLAQLVERQQETTYGEFVSFVRAKSRLPEQTLEPVGLQRQLDELQQVLGDRGNKGSAKELQVLRQMMVDERLDEFRTKKEALLLDVREALLGRLTSPTQRRAEQAAADPQVREAMEIAEDEARYSALLKPSEKELAQMIASPPSADQRMLFPLDM